MATYPSSILSITNPQAADRLSSPDHALQHSTINDNVVAIQSFVGTQSSSFGITYDLRSPSSDGGGHVQSANKGGTGQTSYAKGDLLVATSSSVLSKFAAGLDGQTLVANSSVASGMQWVSGQTNKVAASASVVTVSSVITETSVMSVTVPGSVLGTNNAVRATLYVSNFATNSGSDQLTLRANYGTTSVATVVLDPSAGTASGVVEGKMELVILANQVVNAQRGNFLVNLAANRTSPGAPSSVVSVFRTGTAAENSSADKTLGVTAKWNLSKTDNVFEVNGYTVEKIV